MKTNDREISAFIGHIVEARRTAAAITAHINDRLGVSPAGLDWSHVASASMLAGELAEIAAQFGLDTTTPEPALDPRASEIPKLIAELSMLRAEKKQRQNQSVIKAQEAAQ